ncbi:MAG: helix-turn-helix domain-containing protein [Sciscionella sp.]
MGTEGRRYAKPSGGWNMAHVVIEQPAFGRRLRLLREQKGLTQRGLATGVVNPSYISLLESGDRVPTLQVAAALARVLTVPLSELIGQTAELDHRWSSAGGFASIRMLASRAWVHGEHQRSGEHLTAGFRAARHDGDQSAAIELGMMAADMLAAQGRHQQRWELLTEVRSLLDNDAEPEIVAMLTGSAADAAWRLNRHDEARELGWRALGMLADTRLVNTGEHLCVLQVMIQLCAAGDSTDRAAVGDWARLILAMTDRLGSPALTLRCEWLIGDCLAGAGLIEAAVPHVRAAMGMLASSDLSVAEWVKFCRTAAGVLLDWEADLGEIGRLIRAAKLMSELGPLPLEIGPVRVVEARYAWATGQIRRALRLSAAGSEQLTGTEATQAKIIHGRALRWLGRAVEARDELLTAVAICREQGLGLLESQVVAELEGWTSVEPPERRDDRGGRGGRSAGEHHHGSDSILDVH